MSMGKVVNRVALPPAGAYGWVVVTASFLLQAISGGIAFSVGVFYVEFLVAFDQSKGSTAWVGSVNTGLLFGAGPLAGVLANKFGHRVIVILGGLLGAIGLFLSAFADNVYFLCLTYGVISGVGFCFIYVPSVVMVCFYFDRRRNLAMGLAAAGFACGHFLFAPILSWLIIHYGWRGALIITSGICLNCCVLGALLTPLESWTKQYKYMERNRGKDSQNDLDKLFNVSLLMESRFLVFLCNNVLWNIGSLILLVICTDYVISRGIEKQHGAVLVSTIGLCSLIGRLLIAVAANHPQCNRFAIFVVSTGLSGVAIVLFPTTDYFAMFVFYSAAYGLCFGAQVGVLGVVTTELFGVKRLTSAYGYLMFGNGTGAMLGPPIAGWLYDATHRYDISFFFGGSMTLISAVILVVIPFIGKKDTGPEVVQHIILSNTEVITLDIKENGVPLITTKVDV